MDTLVNGRLALLNANLVSYEFRADDKMASEYNLEAGATLHLVLALRGGI